MKGSAEVVARAEYLFGAPFVHHDGVVHVTSVFADGELLRVIRIGPGAPKSSEDRFSLDLARARADAIIVTGAVLREERDLEYELTECDREALLEYRREVLGRHEPPDLVVLTSGRGFDSNHPALKGWPRPLIFTDLEGGPLLDGTPFPIIAHPTPSLAAAIAHLGTARGAKTITIEAGPTAARTLYTPPLAIDELLLTRYEAPVPHAAQGPPLLRVSALDPFEFGPTRTIGPWSFVRGHAPPKITS